MAKLTFCFAGKMSEKREFYVRQAETMGHRVVEEISKDVDILFIGENPGEKFHLAEELNEKYGLGIEIRSSGTFDNPVWLAKAIKKRIDFNNDRDTKIDASIKQKKIIANSIAIIISVAILLAVIF